MRVALLSPPFREEAHFLKPIYPLGLGYIKATCKQNDIHCDVYDLSNTILSDDELCVKYRFSDYDIIGFSTYTLTFRSTLALAEKIKTNRNIVVFGGHHASLLGGKLLQEFEVIDYVMVGYSENCFVDFVKCVTSDDLTKVSGLCYRSNGIIHENEPVYNNLELGKLPYPDYEDITYDCPEKSIDTMDLPIASSRGCVFRCAYCVNCRRNFWIARPVEDVIKEVWYRCTNAKVETVNFVDCNFFIDPCRAVEIIEGINALIPSLRIVFQARSDQVLKNKTIVEYLLDNYNVKIYMGIESNSSNVLKRYQKDTSPEVNQKAVDILKKYYKDVIVFFIMFDPLSTLEEVRESFNFLKSNNLYNFQNARNLGQIMIPFYGTDYYDNFKDYFDIDLHAISKGRYVNFDVQSLKDCYELFVGEYDDRIKGILCYMLEEKKEMVHRDFLFLNTVYFYVFELFLLISEKHGSADYSAFSTTPIANELDAILSKYEGKIMTVDI